MRLKKTKSLTNSISDKRGSCHPIGRGFRYSNTNVHLSSFPLLKYGSHMNRRASPLHIANAIGRFSQTARSFVMATVGPTEGSAPSLSDSVISNARKGRAFYEKIGSPKMILAPMVDQSEFVRLESITFGIGNVLIVIHSGMAIIDPLLHSHGENIKPSCVHAHVSRSHVPGES